MTTMASGAGLLATLGLLSLCTLSAAVTTASASEPSCPLQCQCQSQSNRVNCTSAGLSQWPRNLPPTTQTLILTGNDLAEIVAQDLALYPQLKTLVVSYNRLNRFDLSSSPSSSGFQSLETIDLSHNRLESLAFLADLPRVSYLNLASNLIVRLERGTLASNRKLQWLSLRSNPIGWLETSAFDRNQLLEFLSLSGLDVDVMPARLLDPLTRLRHLEVSDNRRLERVDDQLFHYLGSLRYLNMANNSLHTVPRSIRQLESLKYLRLDGNAFVCDCQLFWFANWLEKRGPQLETTSSLSSSAGKNDNGPPIVCNDHQPLMKQLWTLQCSAVRLQTSTLFQETEMGNSLVLTCNFSGSPTPNVTWVTADRSVLRWPQDAEEETNDKSTATVRLLSAEQLSVKRLSRHTAGDYSCHASNPLSNVTAFMRVQITPTGFRRVQIQSIYIGFSCVLAFVVITLVVQGFRWLMDR